MKEKYLATGLLIELDELPLDLRLEDLTHKENFLKKKV
jgi:hypothetical protein